MKIKCRRFDKTVSDTKEYFFVILFKKKEKDNMKVKCRRFDKTVSDTKEYFFVILFRKKRRKVKRKI
jgi:hypothetical protein